MGDFHDSLEQLKLSRMQKLVAMRWLAPEGASEPKHIGTFKTQQGHESAQYTSTEPNGTTHGYEVWKDADGNAQIRTFQVAENLRTHELKGPQGTLGLEGGWKSSRDEGGHGGPGAGGRLVGAEAK